MICILIFMSALKVIGIIVLILVVLLGGVGIYFYNYYVFETVRICVGEGVDSGLLCNMTQDCFDLIGEERFYIDLDDAPRFVKEVFKEVVVEAVFCNKTCFVKNIRGVNYESQELEMLKSCGVGEKECVFGIKGKEVIEILRYLKERE